MFHYECLHGLGTLSLTSCYHGRQLIQSTVERCDVIQMGTCYCPAGCNQTPPLVSGLAIKQNKLGGAPPVASPGCLAIYHSGMPKGAGTVLISATWSSSARWAAARVELRQEWWRSRAPWGRGTLRGRIRHAVCVCFLSSAFGLWLHLLSLRVQTHMPTWPNMSRRIPRRAEKHNEMLHTAGRVAFTKSSRVLILWVTQCSLVLKQDISKTNGRRNPAALEDNITITAMVTAAFAHELKITIGVVI